jgi:hypothetical protein
MGTVLTMLLMTFAVFGIAMAIMSVGVIFSGRCMRGTCGSTVGPDGEELSCDTCPNKKEGTCPKDQDEELVLN